MMCGRIMFCNIIWPGVQITKNWFCLIRSIIKKYCMLLALNFTFLRLLFEIPYAVLLSVWIGVGGRG